MAKFAPVAPIQVLEQLYDHNPGALGEYHLLLAHHTAEHASRFRALFDRIARDGIINPLIIMDNSVVETGGYVDFGLMRAAVNACRPETFDVIPVLPDVMGEGEATRNAVADAYEDWVLGLPRCPGFMAVCQGKDYNDFVESLDEFSSRKGYPCIEYLGIPRILVEKLGTREHAVNYAVDKAVNKGTNHRIHLLGYSDDMIDDLHRSHNTGVHGIDSAVPLRVEGEFSFNGEYGPRPKDWFETAQLDQQMLANLMYARQQHERC